MSEITVIGLDRMGQRLPCVSRQGAPSYCQKLCMG